MLEVSDLEAGYGAFQVLFGVRLAVAEGEVVALLGANGAGKTTLNRALSGLLRPRAGRVRFAGADITGADPAAIVAAGLIHVPEGRKIFPNLTVRENLLLGAYARGRAERARTLDEVLDTFPRLRERRSQLVGSMSGGEQQMVAIGRGLMARPKLLILDEPSLGLSPLLVEELFALIRRLHASGLSILLVEQNVLQSLGVAGRAYVMEHGSLALEGESAALLEDPRLKAAYLGM
ncbi:MAG TPA: ABC transporter ATP-binding protein [Acetobacteraceae bacterium]|nr:ABC transporter ATP-binding protein [Acetobacteraceae bacterium]